MSNGLASNSKIEVRSDLEGLVVKIPQPDGGVMRYGAAIFILFWLGGWSIGWVAAIGTLLTGGADAFLVFWLGGWTVGGFFAMLYAYRLLRPSVPETWHLDGDVLHYDSGIAPIPISFNRSGKAQQWEELFRKRLQLSLNSHNLRTITLREFELGNRLTIDYEGKRLDLARGATEVEREWLYQFLRKQYLLN